jgi:hypothetical protein
MNLLRPATPIGLVLFSLLAVAICGLFYAVFGAGADPFLYTIGLLLVYAIPLAVILGIAGFVRGIWRLARGR